MSQDIRDTSLRSSTTAVTASMLGHAATDIESPPGHHRLVRRPPEPRGDRRPLRRPPWLGLQAQGARYEAEGEAALEPRSRRPKTSPNALSAEVVDLIVRVREELTDAGLDAGPETISWHLEQHHGHRVARSTISRHLTAAGLVVPEPKKRPKSSYIRFEASMPNQTWQSDFTHYRLTRPDDRPGTDVEIITWLDDCTRYALHISAHARVTIAIVRSPSAKPQVNTASPHPP